MRRIILAIFGILVIFFTLGCDLFNNNSTSETGDKYVVTFDSNGGEEINPIYVDKNTTITLPIPVRVGYSFEGWLTGAIMYNLSLEVKENLELTAVWEIND